MTSVGDLPRVLSWRTCVIHRNKLGTNKSCDSINVIGTIATISRQLRQNFGYLAGVGSMLIEVLSIADAIVGLGEPGIHRL
jgi:hypothetical protein